MYLNELFKEAPKVLVEQISCDSRLPMKNCIFFCISGVKYDGHDYVKEAINNGANIIVYSKDIDTSYDAIFIKVKNINSALANCAKKLFNYDKEQSDIFVTCGCYGKSCVSSYINQLINKKDLTASIGAYGINYKDKHLTYPSATLTLLDNYKYLSTIKNEGCKYITLETNALNISYSKLDGINPRVFIYTNTSQYSKDYIGFSYKYFDSLRKYLYTLEDSTLIILNRDDESYNELINACSNNVISYGFDSKSTFQILNDKYYTDHTTFDLKFDDKIYHVVSPLISKSNIYDLVAALASLVYTNIESIENVLSNINNLFTPEGIMDRLKISDKNIIVDYCYSLDSYQYILEYCKELKNINKFYFILPVNYGDNKDTISKYFNYIKDISFLTIFTENMIYDQDIHELLNEASKCANGYNFLTIENRELAIKTAIDLLDKNDLLFILGKGNGKYFNKNFNKIIYPGDNKVATDYLKDDNL